MFLDKCLYISFYVSRYRYLDKIYIVTFLYVVCVYVFLEWRDLVYLNSLITPPTQRQWETGI